MINYYKGKTSRVTGSSRGLGRCLAEMLAGAGCNVVLSGRSQTNLQSSGEGNTPDEAAEEIAWNYGVCRQAGRGIYLRTNVPGGRRRTAFTLLIRGCKVTGKMLYFPCKTKIGRC